ncbi:hypothetical protein C1Y63_09850 [Corynebacterium sp. 13CS0277]|uniref:hypothetical protein n=1 Tax=Corynebacterium sp. 13CS0277 TaxID=2071994 RepID=UPI000D03BB50|nr:hypothetical protein [Corynebacterium sp. 13CS0277]PRQ10753.1 hypothetical protein C1Y63_09850 [Corynebacterium sp. 13CS0277]
MDMKLKKAEDVNTASLVITGLIGGWLTAKETGIRPLGGVVLAAMGGLATRAWVKKSGPMVTIGLLGTYLGAFGLSHPLAKKIGAWPAVLAVTAVASGAACVANDIRD